MRTCWDMFPEHSERSTLGPACYPATEIRGSCFPLSCVRSFYSDATFVCGAASAVWHAQMESTLLVEESVTHSDSQHRVYAIELSTTSKADSEGLLSLLYRELQSSSLASHLPRDLCQLIADYADSSRDRTYLISGSPRPGLET